MNTSGDFHRAPIALARKCSKAIYPGPPFGERVIARILPSGIYSLMKTK